jgi:mitogen-activated protein kinase kinase kinase
MAAIASNNLHSPSKPSSPTSPTQSMNQPPPRSFIHLNQGIRGQHSPFPTTPTSSHAHSILEPPPAMSYSDFIRSWTDNHVSRWLTDVKCGHHATAFKANDIRGDIVLELDQTLLKEMGIASIGDRLRIVNAVKALRQRSSSRPATASVIDISRPKLDQITEPRTPAVPERSGAETTAMRGPSRGGRPAPLQLNPNINRDTLPRLEPDSASRQSHNPIVRPLPQPSSTASQPSTQPSSNTSNAHTVVSSTSRTNLPPLPPPPGKPPPPPTARPPARPPNIQGSSDRRPPQSDPGPPPPYTTQPLHLPPSRDHLTPSPGSNRTGHLPNDSRPVNSGGGKNNVARSTSPLLVGRITRPLVTNTTHGRNGSLALNSPVSSNLTTKLPPRPSTGNSHPYATATAQLAPTQPQSQAHNLSPIAESFLAQHTPVPGTPSPPSVAAYTVGRGSFNPSGNPNGNALPLDALRRKLVKFMLPAEGLASTIDVATCAGGVEVLEKVLKKFGKSGSRSVDTDGGYVHMEEGGLNIDGWGVYMGMGNEDGPGMFFLHAFVL